MKKYFKFSSILFCGLIILAVTGCASTESASRNQSGISVPQDSTVFNERVLPSKEFEQWADSFFVKKTEDIIWEKPASFAQYAKIKDKDFPIILHLVKIDLTSPDLHFTFWPDCSVINKDGSIPQEMEGISGSTFARKSKSIVALNTTPFAKKGTGRYVLVGVHKAENIVYSEPVERYSAISFTEEKTPQGDHLLYRGRIEQTQKSGVFENDIYSFGGFFTILKDGQILPYIQNRDSNMSLGLSEDGTTLFILCTEGEIKFSSKGLSFCECGLLLKKLGATNAIGMDGGYSASLLIKGKNVLSYPSLRKNRGWLGFN